jgi:AcrR family transcriptional regulator
VTIRSGRPRTLPAEERRKQIVDAVLHVVSEYGVPETTTARIAEAAGVAEGTLYLHFGNRTAMLTAALDAILTQMLDLVRASTEEDPVERLKDIAKRHSDLMCTERGGFVVPWVEFIASGPQVGLREAVAKTQRQAFEALRDIVEEGKAAGRIRADEDADQLAWCWLSFAWAETMGCLMGLDEFLERRPSYQMLEAVLNAAQPPSEDIGSPSGRKAT